MVAWQPIRISMGVFDRCHRYESPIIYFLFIPLDTSDSYFMRLYRYLKERKQFRAPLVAFQLNQEKLVVCLPTFRPCFLLVGDCANCMNHAKWFSFICSVYQYLWDCNRACCCPACLLWSGEQQHGAQERLEGLLHQQCSVSSPLFLLSASSAPPLVRHGLS
jgi:hypothetical protein